MFLNKYYVVIPGKINDVEKEIDLCKLRQMYKCLMFVHTQFICRDEIVGIDD